MKKWAYYELVFQKLTESPNNSCINEASVVFLSIGAIAMKSGFVCMAHCHWQEYGLIKQADLLVDMAYIFY